VLLANSKPLVSVADALQDRLRALLAWPDQADRLPVSVELVVARVVQVCLQQNPGLRALTSSVSTPKTITVTTAARPKK
jgi:hypothetical protein